MTKRTFTVKSFVNKKTKQISIVLPKKQLNLGKVKIPKEFKVEIKW